MSKPVLGFIGKGKVGQTLAHLAQSRGYEVSAVYTRHDTIFTVEEVVEESDLVFLTVPDNAIVSVANSLWGCEWQGKAAVHTSGVHSLEVLEPIRERGGMVGSLHPAYPFSGVVKSLKGVTFAVEAPHPLLQAWLDGLISAFNGTALHLPSGSKALYHAALVITSNYTVTLYAVAERMLLELGASPEASTNALNHLMNGTMRNLETQGIPHALTGPLVRNDTGTIQAHLAALQTVDAELASLYRQLARLTYPLVEARGVDTTDIEAILQENENATDHP